MTTRPIFLSLFALLAAVIGRTGGASSSISIETCQNSIIAVSSVEILCDSPYTYYWGNGAHRNSANCDYGDKATITINFNITENLVDGEDVYVTLGVYAAKSDYELLYSLRAAEMCSTYLNRKCVYAGSYSFSISSSFNYVSGSDLTEFVPFIEMGFSSQPDEGYNLGGANIECWIDEEENFEEYNPWLSTNSTKVNTTQKAIMIASNYVILVGVIFLISVFAVVMWKSVGHQATYSGSTDDVGLLGIGNPSRALS